jgi:hypothetical protein
MTTPRRKLSSVPARTGSTVHVAADPISVVTSTPGVLSDLPRSRWSSEPM